MTDQQIAAAAESLARARRDGKLIESLPGTPASVAIGHAIQDRVTALTGESVGGFKISAPVDQEPTRGVIYSRTIHQSPVSIPVANAPHLGIEGEIAFAFTRDLPPRAAPYTRAEVAAASSALVAIEVVSGRYRDFRGRPKLEQLADGMANAGMVVGTPVADWSGLDIANLHLTLLVNGEIVLERDGGHPSGDPLGSAVVLVNMQRAAGGVKAGQIVITGACTGLHFLNAGDHCVVRFDGLGAAELTFTP